jgi:hypothetical protein
MNTPLPDLDDFEAFLAAQPFRQPPAECREGILATARQASPILPMAPRRNRTFPGLRHGWSALALIWLGLAFLRYDTPAAPVYAGRHPRPSLPELSRQLTRHQEEAGRLFALITGSAPRGTAGVRPRLAPQPPTDSSLSLPIP